MNPITTESVSSETNKPFPASPENVEFAVAPIEVTNAEPSNNITAASSETPAAPGESVPVGADNGALSATANSEVPEPTAVDLKICLLKLLPGQKITISYLCLRTNWKKGFGTRPQKLDAKSVQARIRGAIPEAFHQQPNVWAPTKLIQRAVVANAGLEAGTSIASNFANFYGFESWMWARKITIRNIGGTNHIFKSVPLFGTVRNGTNGGSKNPRHGLADTALDGLESEYGLTPASSSATTQADVSAVEPPPAQ